MMIKRLKFIFFIGLLIAISALKVNVAHAESQDIIVLSLSPSEGMDGLPSVGTKPLHVTKRDGYDNQPKFSSDGNSIYFTRMQSVDDTDNQQTDIYRYTFNDKTLQNITKTNDHSEYSATPYQENAISIIGVNPDGEQHLRKVKLETGEQEVLRADIEPVGYHAWLNPTQAAVFVLGDTMTLQILDTESEQMPLVLSEDIGRCLETLFQDKVSFTQKIDGQHRIFALDASSSIIDTGIVLPEGVQDYVWLNERQVIVGEGSKLFVVAVRSKKLLADLKEHDIDGISRLALSPDKRSLALVYTRP